MLFIPASAVSRQDRQPLHAGGWMWAAPTKPVSCSVLDFGVVRKMLRHPPDGHDAGGLGCCLLLQAHARLMLMMLGWLASDYMLVTLFVSTWAGVCENNTPLMRMMLVAFCSLFASYSTTRH